MGLKTWIDGVVGACSLARRFAGDVRGNVAMLFGLSLPVLILMTFGGVDIHRMSTVRVNLQDALDAAALAAARSPYTDDADLQRVGLAALKANLKSYPNVTLEEDQTSFSLNGEDVVIADARVQVKTLVANIFLPPYGQLMDDYLPVGSHSEVDRSSRNLEVALVLDVTGSMGGQKIIDLKTAAKELVDIIVQPVQSPYYSKLALVPYSMGVNLGSAANAARGAPIGSTSITGAVINLVGTEKAITGATKDRPVVITSSSHGFSNDDVVWITGATGMTQLNNKAYRVRNRTTNTFELYTLNGWRVDGRYWGTYSGNAKVRRCQNNDCSVTITSNGHGMSNNQYVYITGVNGMTQLNNETYLVGNATTNTFTIDPNLSALTPYTSGGSAWCAQQGCTWFAFENMYGDLQTHQISSCVTERTGSQAYTDVSPSSARVGRNYPSASSNTCLDATLQPLSSNKSILKSAIDGYSVQGSTAGQIGIGWGWYMVSPNFNSLWPSSGAAEYNTADTLKAVIIMTDGEFNTPYCSGVISRQAGTGSGSNTGKIDCDADNGDPFDQGRAMCAAMKARGVLVYTVGFQITAGGNAANMLEACASTPANFYLPASGGDLSEAFAAIGRDITQLRISK
ncbi:MAG: ubiquitin-activating E1 FCCH domain-containing protein [Brevundimonas sp.]|uniref:TadE/TadG family type IV pilus assembly protein n=1 Tax=Brevundimonas sp. TaxID=1871086 RepID=UPI002621C3F9|nr:TadE/TadG family type IV pilus assembly protein [Brevundimonas sp.]MDI6624174.1 ubiquitin-activating E1 FCCH domain-containing protein [Brevundimonas sp.]MDQ7811575.1 ubiquitin-activating E1 FCCH domain-containing protein [Brevundimonas sp.]